MAVSLSAKLGLGGMEALPWDPSFLTDEPFGCLLDEGEEEILPEGPTSPLSSSSSSYADAFPSSPLSSLSPPSSPLLGCEARTDLLSLHWLPANELPYGHIGAGGCNEDAFSDMDWMAEKMDLNEFDLDTLMGSCASDPTPSSSDDLMESLDSTVDLLEPLPCPDDGFLFPSSAHQEELSVALPDLPEPQAELEIKSEPPSPVPSLSLLPPLSPAFTLDLGSEVDVSESQKTLPDEKVQVPHYVLSLAAPSSIVVLLASKEEPIPVATTAPVCSKSESDLSTPPSSPCSPTTPQSSRATGSSRTKPYSAPSKTSPVQEPPALTGKVKSASGGGGGEPPKVVEKKLKKMEQNKTAATRYRQKKRAEQEALGSECAELEQRNQELVEKAESISKEIQYLKDLMEEVRKAKSRKNKAASRGPAVV